MQKFSNYKRGGVNESSSTDIPVGEYVKNIKSQIDDKIDSIFYQLNMFIKNLAQYNYTAEYNTIADELIVRSNKGMFDHNSIDFKNILKNFNFTVYGVTDSGKQIKQDKLADGVELSHYTVYNIIPKQLLDLLYM